MILMADKKQKPKKSRTRDVAEIILAFFVAWLGYQALALVAGTNLPVVAVVSDSMYHNSEFNDWWTSKANQYSQLDISENQFLDFPFRNGLSRGDLLLVVNQPSKTGDVIIYDRGNQFTIVHRLVKSTNGEYVTRGDNNLASDQPIAKNQIKGKVVFAVPLLGYP